jgi:hypothetical protein
MIENLYLSESRSTLEAARLESHRHQAHTPPRSYLIQNWWIPRLCYLSSLLAYPLINLLFPFACSFLDTKYICKARVVLLHDALTAQRRPFPDALHCLPLRLWCPEW